MNFPEGVTWTQRYITGGDILEIPIDIKVVGNLWKYSRNPIIDFQGIDTSNVTDMSYMFDNCTTLLTVTHFDTSSVTNMSYMFDGCMKLTTVPLFDTSKVTSMSYMFQNCRELTSVPHFDTSSVTDMSYMFNVCSALTTVPAFDTSSVTDMSYMFQNCNILTTIPQLDCSKVRYIGMFGYSGCASLVNLGGFKNLGMQKSLSTPTGNYFLGASSNLTHESIMNVINNLYDRKTAGYSVLTLKLHANTLALLSDEEKAIATNKGWTLS